MHIGINGIYTAVAALMISVVSDLGAVEHCDRITAARSLFENFDIAVHPAAVSGYDHRKLLNVFIFRSLGRNKHAHCKAVRIRLCTCSDTVCIEFAAVAEVHMVDLQKFRLRAAFRRIRFQ